ncbi:hypothetical protein HOQ54_gp08 [uncultured phage MedDCM-OCT-S46-C10]|uniref:Uncharacterized protein n=1 Tax=uncultured phage MedDCM-OCT-S46-C10 TaxID=2741074 RepID=A0A6S4PM09_9CAUD|nr:hypothetical protein HOQ54_gp08 [uncultured phage_MedDCM-OCT-S46-C10]BAQ94294.1 hypothetical protein [uncultured phage_MedDCM-OCT-S46-C10]
MMFTLLISLIVKIKNMRDIKKLTEFTKNKEHKNKEMNLFKNLKKEVSVNGNGTREYVIKKGINKGKIAK